MENKSKILFCKHCRNEIITNSEGDCYCSELCRHQEKMLLKKEKLTKKEYADAYVTPIVKYLIEQANFLGEIDMHGKLLNYYHIAGFNENIKQQILVRDEYRCRICSRDNNLHIHHIIPRIQGGSHKSENLITLCASCHGSVETRDIASATKKCIKNFMKEVPKVLTSKEILTLNLSNRIQLEALYEILIETPENKYLELDKKTILKEFVEIIEIYD